MTTTFTYTHKSNQSDQKLCVVSHIKKKEDDDVDDDDDGEEKKHNIENFRLRFLHLLICVMIR